MDVEKPSNKAQTGASIQTMAIPKTTVVPTSRTMERTKKATAIANVYFLTINSGAIFVKLKKFHTDKAAPTPIQNIQAAAGQAANPAARATRQVTI